MLQYFMRNAKIPHEREEGGLTTSTKTFSSGEGCWRERVWRTAQATRSLKKIIFFWTAATKGACRQVQRTSKTYTCWGSRLNVDGTERRVCSTLARGNQANLLFLLSGRL